MEACRVVQEVSEHTTMEANRVVQQISQQISELAAHQLGGAPRRLRQQVLYTQEQVMESRRRKPLLMYELTGVADAPVQQVPMADWWRAVSSKAKVVFVRSGSRSFPVTADMLKDRLATQRGIPRVADVYICECSAKGAVCIKGGMSVNGWRRAKQISKTGLRVIAVWQAAIFGPSMHGDGLQCVDGPTMGCHTNPETEWKRLMGSCVSGREVWDLSQKEALLRNISWVLNTSPLSSLRDSGVQHIVDLGQATAAALLDVDARSTAAAAPRATRKRPAAQPASPPSGPTSATPLWLRMTLDPFETAKEEPMSVGY